MRKSILTLATLTVLISCDKEVKPIQELPNCDCNEVVYVWEQPTGFGEWYGTYSTINQCTGEQVDGTFNTSKGDSMPSIGDCKQ